MIARFAPYFLSVFIAILGFFSGATTDIGESLQIALDKDKALAQAVEILNETPKAEIVEAVKEQE